MTSQDILELLSRSIDEELAPGERARVEAAFLEEPELRDLQETLKKNKEFCLQTHISPPQLNSLNLLELTTPKKTYLAWALPLAAACIMAGWLFFRSENTPQPENVDPLNQELLATQQAFHSAIQALEVRAEQRLEQLPDHLQLIFRENLALVNHAIQSCEAAIPQDNAQYLAYKTLSQAYETKIKLLEQILKT